MQDRHYQKLKFKRKHSFVKEQEKELKSERQYKKFSSSERGNLLKELREVESI